MVDFALCEISPQFTKKKNKSILGDSKQVAPAEILMRDDSTQASGCGMEMKRMLFQKHTEGGGSSMTTITHIVTPIYSQSIDKALNNFKTEKM